MTEKFKILGKFIKDLSSETPDIGTYLLAKERIRKYQLGIEIDSKALKNKMIEINTKFMFQHVYRSSKGTSWHALEFQGRGKCPPPAPA